MKRGFKGTICDGTHCPVANYLKSKFPDAYTVGVDPDDCSVWGEFDYTYIQSPKRIAKFIKRFDEGEFPELEVK